MLRPLLILFAIYCLGHFWLPLNRGIFWDDWVWRLNPEDGLQSAWELGLPVLGYISYLFLDFQNEIISYKDVSFLNYFIVSFGLFYILTKYKLLDKENAFWLCALFAVFPLNHARVAFCIGQYGVCYALFTIASILLLERKTWSKALSVPLFIISFFTNSLLVFFLVPILVCFYLDFGFQKRFKSNIKNAFQFFKSNWFIVILPPIFWTLKKKLFVSYGAYSNYNQIDFGDFFFNLTNWKITFAQATLKPIFYLFENATEVSQYYYNKIILGLAIVSALTIYLKKQNKLKPVGIGLFIFVIAALPYMAVHKLPTFHTWESRHQLLMPLGVALIFFGLCQQLAILMGNIQYSKYLMTALIVLSIGTQWKLYSGYQRDWYKQLGLIEAIKKESIFKDHTTFLMQDTSPYWKVPYLHIAFYNYNGMLRMIFGNQQRLAANELELTELQSNPEALLNLAASSRYNMDGYKPVPAQFKVSYEVKEEKSWKRLFQLLFLEWLKPEQMNQEMQGLVQLKTEKIN